MSVPHAPGHRARAEHREDTSYKPRRDTETINDYTE
jgi:hypothetical protein